MLGPLQCIVHSKSLTLTLSTGPIAPNILCLALILVNADAGEVSACSLQDGCLGCRKIRMHRHATGYTQRISPPFAGDEFIGESGVVDFILRCPGFIDFVF